MNKTIATGAGLLLLLSLLVPSHVRAENESRNESAKIPAGTERDLRISHNNKIKVDGAKIVSVSGTSLTAELKWGSTVLTWIVNTTASTKLLRRYDGASGLSEFSAGDLVSFQGELVETAAFTVTAKEVKDWSIQQRNASFSGIVATVTAANQSFTIPTEKYGTVTVLVTASTTLKATAGTTTPLFSEIQIGTKVSVEGLLNTEQKTVTAKKVQITRVAPPAKQKTTFEGKLLSVAASSTPTTFVYSIGNSTVTVNVPAGISIVDRNYAIASLANFRNGDKVRVYGSLSGSTVEATIVRNTSLPR